MSLTHSQTSAFLASCSLFKGLSSGEIEHVCHIANLHTYNDEEFIFTQGGRAQHIFLLRKGLLRFYISDKEGNDHFIGLSEMPGAYFGEDSLLNDVAYSSYGQSIGITEVYLISHADFIKLFESQPRIAQNIAINATRNLRNLGIYLTKFNNSHIEGKVVELLYRLTQSSNANITPESHFLIDRSQDKVADMIGATRPSVYKIIKKYQDLGAIELLYGKIRIIDMDILMQDSRVTMKVYGGKAER